MSVACLQAADDGVGELQYTTGLKDPLARNVSHDEYDLTVLRTEIAAKLNAAAEAFGRSLPEDWSIPDEDLSHMDATVDVAAVMSNFHTVGEIRQTFKDLFVFLFSEDGLSLTVEDVEKHPTNQSLTAMYPRFMASGFEFLSQVFGVNPEYVAVPFDDHVLFLTPATMRLCDAAIAYRLRGGSVMLAISGLAKSPLLEHVQWWPNTHT